MLMMIKIKNLLSLNTYFKQILNQIDYLKLRISPSIFSTFIEKNEKVEQIPPELDFKEELKKLEEIQESIENKIITIFKIVVEDL